MRQPSSGHRPTAPPNDLALRVEIIRLLGGLDCLSGVDVDRTVGVPRYVDNDIRTTIAKLDIRAYLVHASDVIEQVVDLAAHHDATAGVSFGALSLRVDRPRSAEAIPASGALIHASSIFRIPWKH
ncbi:MAG: hypothetical protein M3Y49_13415 [Actinomycetota bacterium]|nr:hypothetical protein [Actinomycetota bacterium]